MNYIDVMVLIPVLWGMYHGFRKGLIFEVTSILALLLGIYISIHFSGFIAELLASSIDPRYVDAVAFTITFIGTLVLMFLLAKAISKFLESVALGFINKIGGIFFGAAKYIFIISVVFSLLNMIDPESKLLKKEAKEKSLFYKPVSSIAPLVIPKIRESLEKYSDSTAVVSEKDSLK